MTRIAHIRVYPTDWRSGCMGLTLEQEGLYIRICMFIAETSRRVPIDDSEAARMLNVQTRNYRRVLGELLRLGKVTRHENGYGNDRIEHERRQAEKAADRKPAAEAGGQSERSTNTGSDGQDCAPTSEVTPNYSGYNADITPLAAEIRQQNQCPFIEPEPEPESVVVVEGANDDDVQRAHRRIIEVARPFLKNGGMAGDLQGTAQIRKWLAEGLNLETDILPTIAAVGLQKRTGAISTWSYFNQPLVDAKARRDRPMPEPKPWKGAAAASKPSLSTFFKREANNA